MPETISLSIGEEAQIILMRGELFVAFALVRWADNRLPPVVRLANGDLYAQRQGQYGDEMRYYFVPTVEPFN